MDTQAITQFEEKPNQDLYSELESLIIKWANDGTKTAGSLTRDILNIINKQKL